MGVVVLAARARRGAEELPAELPAVAGLSGTTGRARPVVLAGERILPVAPGLRPLLPSGGLRRGSTVGVAASTSLVLTLLSGPSSAGSWCAVVGLPGLGVAAAVEAGIVLGRLAMVPTLPPERWVTVVAALIDAIDLVVVRPPARTAPATIRRLAARTRERGAVLAVAGSPWWPTELQLEVVRGRWHGLGEGHGHLETHDIEVACRGRRVAGHERTATLRLTAGPDGPG